MTPSRSSRKASVVINYQGSRSGPDRAQPSEPDAAKGA